MACAQHGVQSRPCADLLAAAGACPSPLRAAFTPCCSAPLVQPSIHASVPSCLAENAFPCQGCLVKQERLPRAHRAPQAPPRLSGWAPCRCRASRSRGRCRAATAPRPARLQARASCGGDHMGGAWQRVVCDSQLAALSAPRPHSCLRCTPAATTQLLALHSRLATTQLLAMHSRRNHTAACDALPPRSPRPTAAPTFSLPSARSGGSAAGLPTLPFTMPVASVSGAGSGKQGGGLSAESALCLQRQECQGDSTLGLRASQHQRLGAASGCPAVNMTCRLSCPPPRLACNDLDAAQWAVALERHLQRQARGTFKIALEMCSKGMTPGLQRGWQARAASWQGRCCHAGADGRRTAEAQPPGPRVAHLRLLALLPERPHEQRAQQRAAQRGRRRGRRLVTVAGLRTGGGTEGACTPSRCGCPARTPSRCGCPAVACRGHGKGLAVDALTAQAPQRAGLWNALPGLGPAPSAHLLHQLRAPHNHDGHLSVVGDAAHALVFRRRTRTHSGVGLPCCPPSQQRPLRVQAAGCCTRQHCRSCCHLLSAGVQEQRNELRSARRGWLAEPGSSRWQRRRQHH